CNYDSTLLAWATLSPEMYLQVGAQNLQFSEAGAEARDYLISNYNWTFVGDSPGDLEVSAEVSGSTVILSVSGGSGVYDFEWSGPGEFSSTDSVIVAPVNGVYTVTVSDGCQTWNESFEILSVGLEK